MNKVIFLLLILSFQSIAADNGQYLAREMEALRDSLPLDDPSRVDLTLRLADLYFDISIKEGDGTATPESLKQNRFKALSLYEDSLNGTNGLKKAEGLNRIKIEFQMARLLTRLDAKEKAESYYKLVLENPKTPKKLIEQSALGLAEWYEEDAKYNLANENYKKSIELCSAVETCNYAHYRRAWLLYKDTKLVEAIAELKLSLWDRDGMIKETSLQDMIMFMSNSDTDGINEFNDIKKLSLKTKRPELVQQLTEAFYVAGNRRAGSNLLEKLNDKDSNLYYEVRLLEEFYGFRKWEKVEDYLAKLENKSQAKLPTKKEEQEEVLKILRRFVVQVDAEVEVVPELNTFLKRSIDIYLSFYPNDELRKNMQQGWLKATDSEKEKVDRIGRWIKEDIQFGIKPNEIRKLRQTRLSMAQKLKLNDIVLEEALALKENLKGTEESREFAYVAAREYYNRKDFKNAIRLFKPLADSVVEFKKADQWALLSQNLLLDIYNQEKNFDLIMVQAKIWTSIPEISEDKKIQKEVSSMKEIFVQADFQKAASLGQTTAGLTAFYNFCFANVFADKSCSNAKVLAVKLKDQEKLVSLLEREKDEKALMTEYELMGRFADSAKLHEKFELNRTADLGVYFKIALLFELDQDFANRDRILKRLIQKVKSDKKIDKEYENALFVTLDEANMIDHSSLSIPWSLSRKISLATRLENQESSKATRSIILSQKESVGPSWSKLILEKVQAEYKKPSKINFYGRNSKWLFKKRTQSIESFAKIANSYLEGADIETRIYILQMLKTTYQMMAIELQSTPLPEGLDDESLAQVMNQLADMANPFNNVASDYERLQNEQIAQLKEEKIRINENLASGNEDFVSFIKIPVLEHKDFASINFEESKKLKSILNKNPEDKDALLSLENFYTKNESMRVASYFKGRVNNLKQ